MYGVASKSISHELLLSSKHAGCQGLAIAVTMRENCQRALAFAMRVVSLSCIMQINANERSSCR